MRRKPKVPLAKPDRMVLKLTMQSEILSVDQNTPSFIEVARRAQIIDCAVAAIAELGFARAALAQIAKRARVSNGVILYYFGGKEELIRQVVAHVFSAGDAFIRPRISQTNARSALRSFIEATAAFIAAHPKHAVAVMNIVRAGRSESGASWFDATVTQARQTGLTQILQAGHATGEFRTFAIPVMVNTIIEALDAIPPELAADPALDCAAYGQELAELFDRATRNEPASQ